MKNEIWHEIQGFEMYLVSNTGLIKSLYSNKILKPCKSHKGYYLVGLHKNCKKYKKSVHRIVAQAFIDNPLNLPQVNHKDENKINNCVENLEWCDNKYNCNYGTGMERRSIALSKSVCQYDINGVLINKFQGTRDVERKLNIHHTLISNCCNGKQKTCKGYIWKYEEVK